MPTSFHPSASPLVTAAFAGVIALTVLLFLLGVRQAARDLLGRVLLGTVAWLALWAAIPLSGILQHFDARPPPFAIVFISIFTMGVGLGRSALARRLLDGLPLWSIVAFLGFRLPLEVVMHAAATEGTMPVEMSYAGYNFDIVTGVAALATAVALLRGAPIWIAKAFNWLGSLLLAVIVIVAFLATPMVQAFGDGEHLNTWVAFFPFTYLPTVCVVAAMATHIALFQKLARANRRADDVPR